MVQPVGGQRSGSERGSAGVQPLRIGPRLEVLVNRSVASETIWVVPWRKGKSCIADLQVSLTNKGDSTLTDVVVVLETNAEIYGPSIPRRPDAGSRLLKLAQAADPIPGGPYVRVVYTADMIHPGVSLALNDFVVLRGPSRVKSHVPVTTKDGARGNVMYSFIYGYPLKVSVMARDVPAVAFESTLLTFDMKDPGISKVLHGSSHAEARAGGGLRTAYVMVVRKPECPAPEVPAEIGRKFFRARFSAARCYNSIYLGDEGYVRHGEPNP